MKTQASMIGRRLFVSVLVLVFSAAVGFASGGSEEGAFPSKTITYIIPFDAGGQSDITAQYQKADLEKELGVSVVIKHMPGAGGAVGWSALTKSKPDGYTIAGNNIPHIIVQPLGRGDSGYKTDDLLPLYLFQSTPIGLAVLKDSPYKTLDQFIAYAKANPGKITVAGSGTQSGHHLAILQLEKITGAKFTYIPFTGAAPSVANFLGGHSAALLANSDDLVTHRDKIIVLAIGTDKRFPPLPDAPTFKEQGVKMTAGIDRGVCVPAGTPDNVVKVLEDAFDKVCKSEAFVSKMEEMGFVMHNLKSKKYAEYIEEKKKDYTEIMKELGAM